ncbi:hypothetical protein WJX73_002255 [Symbiochloris irregularis]|uniref:Uncharacterized protein n=1 Tax=Symbiochloris irregularis TaxID=706552 RepID=A0AAW1NXN7_9CHLO
MASCGASRRLHQSPCRTGCAGHCAANAPRRLTWHDGSDSGPSDSGGGDEGYGRGPTLQTDLAALVARVQSDVATMRGGASEGSAPVPYGSQQRVLDQGAFLQQPPVCPTSPIMPSAGH